MSIGANIKRLRREREMTQEQLAECLGITANAVSQWECDRTAPDISQLPTLARVLQVSTDRLLGIDFGRDEQEICRILEESLACNRAGQFARSVEIARNGLKQYPRSYLLMARLAEGLLAMQGSEQEMERLCDKILKECTESGPRDQAYRIKILLYGKRGKYQEIMEIANDLPHIWVSQEEIRMRWNTDIDRERHTELVRYAKMYVGSLTTCLGKIANLPCYTPKEKIGIQSQIIDLMKVIYPEGDYLSQAAILASTYYQVASLYVQLGEYGQALAALDEMCRYSVYCDSHDGKYTSPAYRGCHAENMNTKERSYCREFAALLSKDSAFDALRGSPGYAEVMARLIASGGKAS
ncbi:MAG: helix-turn-helix transcriptional regulator [Ruminococcaceae bacterium]|nr:helix-turn-helix transcriptional regulator [Oscillospiraceae bacterium]